MIRHSIPIVYPDECHPTRRVFTFSATEFDGSFDSILALSTRCCVSETTCTLHQERPLGGRGRAYRGEPSVRSLHADGRESNVSLRDLTPAGDVPGPWIAPEDRPTPPEAPPEDHGTEIAPDTSSNDTVSIDAPSDTSDGSKP